MAEWDGPYVKKRIRGKEVETGFLNKKARNNIIAKICRRNQGAFAESLIVSCLNHPTFIEEFDIGKKMFAAGANLPEQALPGVRFAYWFYSSPPPDDIVNTNRLEMRPGLYNWRLWKQGDPKPLKDVDHFVRRVNESLAGPNGVVERTPAPRPTKKERKVPKSLAPLGRPKSQAKLAKHEQYVDDKNVYDVPPPSGRTENSSDTSTSAGNYIEELNLPKEEGSPRL